MKSNLEKVKILSDLARVLCRKFEMNPYVISIYPRRNEISIQGDEYSESTEEKLIEDGYKLDSKFTDDSNKHLFKDYEKILDGIKISFTLVSEKKTQ